ncbi:MAG: hypothetical protein OXH57_09470 [Ekhidna sp.]|nr:hypothetical protein [Ekhidna sp.]
MSTLEIHKETDWKTTAFDKTFTFNHKKEVLPKVLIHDELSTFGLCVFRLETEDNSLNDGMSVWRHALGNHNNITAIFRQSLLSPKHLPFAIQCITPTDLDVDQDIINVYITRLKALDNSQDIHKAIKASHKLIEDWTKMDAFDLLNNFLSHVSRENFSLPVLVAFLASTMKFKSKLPNRIELFERTSQKAIDQLGLEKFNKSIFRRLN